MVTNRDRKSFRSPRRIPKFAQTTVNVEVFEPHSGDTVPVRGELPHVQVFVNEGSNPLT